MKILQKLIKNSTGCNFSFTATVRQCALLLSFFTLLSCVTPSVKLHAADETNQTSSSNVEPSSRQAVEGKIQTDWRVEQQSADEQGQKVFPTESSSDSVSLTAETNKEHRLSPGDEISLTVFGESDLNLSNARITQSGNVSFPLIGTLEVVGKTVAELEQDVKNRLAQGYVKDPRLRIIVSQYRPIFIRGAVNSAGAFPYTEGLTVTQAIALAGGLRKTAKRDGVTVRRNSEVIYSDLALDSRLPILSGDVISVDEVVGDVSDYIYLHGEVNRPGEYSYREGLTVEKAVVLAGGFSLRASRKRVSITRQNKESKKPIKMRKVKLYEPIEAGDIIDVGASWF